MTTEQTPIPRPPETVAAGHSARMALNSERNGVELYFAERPADDVLAALKANGWRWFRPGRCWYHRDSFDTRAFARDLAEAMSRDQADEEHQEAVNA